MSGKYQFNDDMKEISGFGGDYESIKFTDGARLIARRAVEAALFETVDHNGECDELGPYRPCFSGIAKVRLPKEAE